MTELSSDIVNSNIYKINNNEFINNDSMFSIGITDKDINLISKGKLMLNGVEVGNNELPQTLVYTDKENILNYKLSGTVADFNTFKIKNTEVIRKDNNNIILGAENNTTTLKGTDLYFNNDKIEFNKFVKINDLNDYAKLNKDNSFTGKITSNEIKSNSIETNELKVGGKNVVTDISNFAKLNLNNVFTQKIKGTDIESNKLITNELLLNGVNVNLTDYSTNDNVVKQIEKVIGLNYGGNIQDNGNKTTGKFYFDNVNKYFYECISDNNLTYVDNSKFRPVSNKSISDRIKNLETVESQKLQHPYGHITFTKVGSIVNVIILFYINNNDMVFNENQQLVEIPLKFRPSVYNYGVEVPFSSFPSSSSVRLQINPNNISIWGVQSMKWKMLKTSVTYVSN